MASKSQSLDLEIDPVATSRGGAPPQYIDLDKLKNADGIVTIISQRLSNRAVTFGVFKEFERDRRIERTSFIASTLASSYLAMVTLALARIEKIVTEPKLMAQLQTEAIAKLHADDQDHVRRILALQPVRGGRR